MTKEPDNIFDTLEEKVTHLKRRIEEAGVLAEESIKHLGYQMLAIAAFMCVIFVLYLIVTPLLITSSNQKLVDLGAVPYIFAALLQLCHQMPERSIILSGAPMPVCARDIGIYLGASVGMLLPLLAKKASQKLNSIKIFLLAFIPIGLDGVTQTIMGLRESSHTLRLVTGFIFGFGVLAYVTSRFLSNYTDFRRVVAEEEGLMVTIIASLLFTYILYVGFTEHLNIGYVSGGQAKKIALVEADNEASAYYIPPRAPLSVQADWFAKTYNDHVINDLSSMDWAVKEYNTVSSSYNTTCRRPLGERHLLGLWAVVISKWRKESTGKYVYSNVPGKYVYVDAWTGEKIEEKIH